MRRTIFALLTLLSAGLLLNACGDDDPKPTGPGTTTLPAPAKILVLEDGGTEDTLYMILDSAGFDVTRGGLYYEYAGTDFSAYYLVIMLVGINSGHIIEDSIQQALMDYVSAGGVLLTTEWLLEENVNPILASFLPVAYNNDYGYLPETYIKQVTDPITASVPDTFVTNADWSLSHMVLLPDSLTMSSNRQVLFEGLEGGPALTIGDLGTGHTIHWAMGGEYVGPDVWSHEVRQIFIDIAKFSE